jgi:hypothetical protein
MIESTSQRGRAATVAKVLAPTLIRTTTRKSQTTEIQAGETMIDVPYPHPRRVEKSHNWKNCPQCQQFIASGGPAIQRLALALKRYQRRNMP